MGAVRSPSCLVYAFLFAIQLFGAAFVILSELPEFRQLIYSPGVQTQYSPLDGNLMVAVLLVMQGAYWYRLLRIPIPKFGRKVLVSHLFLFLGRLSFIFGGAIFTVVAFRHLPNLKFDIDISYTVRRAVLFAVLLFALFCVTLELERLGHSLEIEE